MKMVQRTLALVSWSILALGLSGPGCRGRCMEGDDAFDVNGRAVDPLDSEAAVCLPPVPPPPPSLTPPYDVFKDHPTDAKGPKDPDSAIKAVLTLGTCLYGYTSSTVNERLDNLYFTRSRDALNQAVRDRSTCFKDKTNACEAMAECVGIADAFVDPQSIPTEPTAECKAGTRHFTLLPTDTETPLALARWFNCAGMGLECNEEEPYGICELPRTKCNPYIEAEVCADDVPLDCLLFVYLSEYGWLYDQPYKCSDFGLTCDIDAYQGYDTDCVGTGPACILDSSYDNDSNVFDYRLGPIACESETMLRSCIGAHEKLTDCAQLGIGFKCLPGPEPHCGLDTECTLDTPVTCDGDSIVLCNAGRIQKVDCKTLGFTTCDATRGICGPNIYDQGGILK